MKGLLHLYCGEGKGKTTAAMGLAFRCLGHDAVVVIAQFLKSGQSGECHALERFPKAILLGAHPCGKFSFEMDGEERAMTAEAAEWLMQNAFDTARAQNARLLVLDEILAALGLGFLEEHTLSEALDHRPETLEVVMTGRYPTQALLERADYISEIRKLRHPFDQGIPARDGIER